MNKLIILIFLIIIQNSYGQFWEEFCINFEDENNLISIDTNSTNIWQIGKPQKILFDSSFSSPNSIVTDTINPYPINNESSFTYIHYPSNDLYEYNMIELEFVHRFNMDSLSKGYVNLSIDGGNSWIDAFSDSLNPYNYNYIHYNFNTNEWTNSISITGTSNGWIRSHIMKLLWEYHWEPIDSIIIKFTFTSDSISQNNDGWIIDDFCLEEMHVGNINNLDKLRNFSKIYPNPITKESIIEFENKKSIEFTFELYSIQGELLYIKKINQDYFSLGKIELEKGLYFYLLKQKNQIKGFGKIIK
ncbi:MAG: T9SS type A sorting domain-containing protein [Bacteroidales bacterium]|nr:T9SS type A sorting domain-containing protein [Bacteroidales bacterium]